jgi:acetolactate synthase I/II/III large subunit
MTAMSTPGETVSDVMLETLHALGVRTLFANIGTDYPPLVESLARHEALGIPAPRMVLCAHENTAITAAHGYALATGQGQGVFVHVGVGTQNLGGAVHNAWCGRVPMLIFAGRSPAGTRGERLGSRDNPIHYLQDVRDQAGIVRQYCKWEFNLELPEQSAYALQRGVRLMQSEPRGAIYVTAAREVLGMPVAEMLRDAPEWSARPALGELPEAAAAALAGALRAAQRPLLIASYLGRNAPAVQALVALSEALSLPVIEAAPTYLNFPRDHAHHWGFRAARAVQEADLVLLLDTDVPWIAKYGAPPRGTPVVQLDLDPLKPNILLWDFPVTESHWVDTALALPRVLAHARALPAAGQAQGAARREWLARHRPAAEPARAGPGGRLTPETLGALLGEALGPDAVLFNETITSADATRLHTRRTRPGTYYGLPGGSLGWGGGAALGYKLARPEAQVAWLVGDGSYVFSVPSSLYMTAQRYGAPFLTVIYNNAGWNAVRTATDRVYGAEGQAAQQESYQHRLAPTGALQQVAAAFGCYTAEARTPAALHEALAGAQAALAQGTCAVINVPLAEC